MKLSSIKSAKEVTLNGITVELEQRDGSLHAVTLTDTSGNFFRVAKSDYSTMSAYVLSKPEKVKKYQLAGTLKGVAAVSEQFENDFEANARKSEIERQFNYDEGVKIEVTPVDVEVE